jgi:hypothetical protein
MNGAYRYELIYTHDLKKDVVDGLSLPPILWEAKKSILGLMVVSLSPAQKCAKNVLRITPITMASPNVFLEKARMSSELLTNL